MIDLHRAFQPERLARIEANGQKLWTTVYESESSGRDHAYTYTALIPVRALASAMTRDREGGPFDYIAPCFVRRGQTDRATYDRFGSLERAEPLVIQRDWFGVRPPEIELLEDFRLFHKLFYDRKKGIYENYDEVGESKPIVRVEADGSRILVRTPDLRRYLSARRMAAVVYSYAVEYLLFEPAVLPPQERAQSIQSRSLRVLAVCSLGDAMAPAHSVLYARRAIRPLPLSECGMWPYSEDPPKEYLDFIIGIDPDGRLIRHTCNPDTLANYFGKNPEAPQYLTPICFHKAVLGRYYADPSKYRVVPGSVQCGQLFRLQADTEHSDVVMAFLGDIGRDWPIQEQRHWQAHNCEPHERPMSEAAHRRAFRAERVEPALADFSFRSNFTRLQRDHLEAHGWTIFHEPHADDQYCLHGIHLLLSDSASEFDTQFQRLAKLLIDGINIKAVQSYLPAVSDEKQIGTFGRFLVSRGCATASSIVELLRMIQGLRSEGAAHHKGKEFKKRMERLGAPDRSRTEIHADLLTQADEMLVQLRELLVP